MSHKDAPPETPEQIACREWWEKAQPHVTRAWGRAKDGEFFAEESKLLHQFFMYARNQSLRTNARNQPPEARKG